MKDIDGSLHQKDYLQLVEEMQRLSSLKILKVKKEGGLQSHL